LLLIKAVIKNSKLNKLIDKLPNGVDTIIGEKGSSISGGEQQRIGIARALYKKPQILILDEATSSLDAESEHAISETFKSIAGNTTLLVVAHRLSTIETADNIFVLSDGKIDESGCHNELILNAGEYSRLYEQYKSNTAIS
jgi:ATP-binding cassette subfamily B protein